MTFNPNILSPTVKPQDKDRLAAAIAYIRQRRNAQAFLLLSAKELEQHSAARFALGLCHLQAADLSAAIACFEQALRLLKTLSATLPAALENGETYLKLAEKQIEDKVYLTPMDADFCEQFPKVAEQTVTLALIDAYLQKDMPEQAQRLLAGLTGTAFAAYKQKLLENNSIKS